MNLPDKELKLHHPHAQSTHAVDILAFVEAQEIPPDYFETPYTLAPAPGGEGVYALLRETLRRSGKIGIAYVVIQSRQHLAAVIPEGQSLVLSTLRWKTEHSVTEDMEPPEEEQRLDLATARRMPMASPLVRAGDGTKRYRNSFQSASKALEEKEMKAKKSERIIVEELEGLLDDDDLIDADDLASILGRRRHLPNGYAMRREHAPRRFRQTNARRRRG